MKTGRNEPCPCGSGKKFKACCLEREHGIDRGDTVGQKLLMWIVIGILGAGLITGIAMFATARDSVVQPPDKVWSEEHQHYH